MPVRHGHWMRGKPPGVARTLTQRMEGKLDVTNYLASNITELLEENFEDPEVVRRINIGFPKIRPSRSKEIKERLAHMKKQRTNSDLEVKARNKNCMFIIC